VHRSPPRGRLRRILHATDFSPALRASFDRAVSMARANGSELVLVHVEAPQVAMVGEGYNDMAAAEQCPMTAPPSLK
jgi:nucleotide-binding universal stress UspA family protein